MAIRGYTGPKAGVSTGVIQTDASTAGAGPTAIGRAFFGLMQQASRGADREAAALASEAGTKAGQSGHYQLQDPATITGQSYNEAARDTAQKRLELTARAKLTELGERYKTDPTGLDAAAKAWRDGVAGEMNTSDPTTATAFKMSFDALSGDLVNQAQQNRQKIIRDENRAATISVIQARTTSYSQAMRRAGNGDASAFAVANGERDALLGELLAHGPEAPFMYGGKQYPAGDGAYSAEGIAELMNRVETEGKDQGILGWWEGGAATQARADAWYKAEAPGISQDRKDAIYRSMLGDVKEADYRAAKISAEADKERKRQNALKLAKLEIALERGEAGQGEIERAFGNGTGWLQPDQYSQLTQQMDKNAKVEAAVVDRTSEDQSLARVEIGVQRGIYDQQYLDNAYNGGKGWLDPQDYSRLTAMQDKRAAELGKQQAAFNWAEGVQAGVYHVDPRDDKQRAAVNDHYMEMLRVWSQPEPGPGGIPTEPRSAAEINQLTLNYVGKAGVIPDSLRAQIRGQLRSGTAEQKVAAAQQLEQFRLMNPALLDDFAKADIERGTLIAHDMAAGVPAETALENADLMERIDEPTKKARSETYDFSARNVVPNQAPLATVKDRLTKNLNTWWQRNLPGVENPQVPQEMVAEFNQLARESFIRTGNEQVSDTTATDALQRVWSVSSVNGAAKWTKLAPEAYYGAPQSYGLSQSDNAKWIKDQAVSEFLGKDGFIDAKAGAAADRLSVLPDPYGKRDPVTGGPLYVLQFLQADGQWRPAVDANGNLLRWRPDFNASPKKEELDRATANKLTDAVTARATGLTPGGPMNPNPILGTMSPDALREYLWKRQQPNLPVPNLQQAMPE